MQSGTRRPARAALRGPGRAADPRGLGKCAPDRADTDARALDVPTPTRAPDPLGPRMLLGRMEDADALAPRAVGLRPDASPGWIRAQDVLGVAEAAQRRR